MGQSARSQGVSLPNDMWLRVDGRCRALKVGRSKYFQMLAEADLLRRPPIFAHHSDGKWHFFPEGEFDVTEVENLQAAEPEATPAPPTPASGPSSAPGHSHTPGTASAGSRRKRPC